MKTGVWLGIETTGAAGGIALVLDGTTLAEKRFPLVGTSAQRLLPGMEALFDSAGITPGSIAGIAVSAGPGSYTGVRVGIATAEGLAAGWDVRLKGVDTLYALARGCGSVKPVLSCIRARKGEVFACLYGDGGSDPLELASPGAYTLAAIVELVKTHPGAVAVGGGQVELQAVPGLEWPFPELVTPSPSAIASAGAFLASVGGFDASVRPRYLRGFMERASDAVT